MKSIRRIKKEIFNSSLSREWKKFIKKLIRKYSFDDEVIFTLLEYCKNKEHLEQEYISVVAESWKKHNIIKSQDLDNYCIKYEGIVKLKRKIKKYMGKEITQFEEAYIEKWIRDYKLSNNVIISVLKNATDKNFDKLDKELTKIYDNN